MTQQMRAVGLHRDPAEDNRRTSGLQAGPEGRSPAQIGAIIVLLVLNVMFWLFQFLFFQDIDFVAIPVVSNKAKRWQNSREFSCPNRFMAF